MDGIGLVLEGGGMRGVYTSGVLEFFMEKDLHFNHIVGVSAGACNAASFISRQKGRNKAVTIDFIKDKRYFGMRNLIREGSLFGWDYIFNEIPNRLVPFDYDAFYNSSVQFLAGTTDCKTGEVVYFSKEEMTRDFDVLRASSSLPLISPIVNINGHELLDGGLADPIPIRKSIQAGNKKHVIVLTQNKGYVKKPESLLALYKMKYKKYPGLLHTMTTRHQMYNETLEFIEELEQEGSCFVIRPTKPLRVGRFEKDPGKLLDLHQNGYEDAREMYQRLREFIEESKVCTSGEHR